MLRLVSGLGRIGSYQMQRLSCFNGSSCKFLESATNSQRTLCNLVKHSVVQSTPKCNIMPTGLSSITLQRTSLLQCIQPIISQSIRPVTKFSLLKGKRKTVKAVIKRFKRLHWGGWIRTHAGRHKRLCKKSKALKRRLRQHIFVNSTQSALLDKMVTKFWKRPKYYIDDPYEPYHTREEYPATRSKPV